MPTEKYGRPLYCKVTQPIKDILTTSISRPTKINSDIVDVSKMQDLFRVLFTYLATNMDTEEGQKIVAQTGAAVGIYIGKYAVKAFPWQEFVHRFINEIGSIEKYTKRFFDLFMLGSGCITISTSPVTCTYSPLCNANWLISLQGLLMKQTSELRLDILFKNFNENLDQNTKVSDVLFANDTWKISDDTKSLADLYLTMFRIYTMNNTRRFRVRANSVSGLPDCYRLYKPVTLQELYNTGYLGTTLRELEAVEQFVKRCATSFYSHQDFMPNINSVESDEYGNFTEDMAKRLQPISLREFWSNYNNNLLTWLLVTDLLFHIQWHLDEDESNNECTRLGFDIPDWSILPKTDSRWRLAAIYYGLPHKLLFNTSSDNVEEWVPRRFDDILLEDYTADNSTRINGELYNGPNIVKVNGIFQGSISSRRGDLDIFPTMKPYQDSDGMYYLWTNDLINFLKDANQQQFFIGIANNVYLSVTHYELLVNELPRELVIQTFKKTDSLDSSNNPMGYFTKFNSYNDDYFTACVDPSVLGSIYTGYQKLLLETSYASIVNVSNDNNSFNFIGPGPSLKNFLNISQPIVKVDGLDEFIFNSSLTASNTDFKYPGRYVDSRLGTYKKFLKQSSIDLLCIYVVDKNVLYNSQNLITDNNRPIVALDLEVRRRLQFNNKIYISSGLLRIAMAMNILNQDEGDASLDLSKLKISGLEETMEVVTELNSFQYSDLAGIITFSP